MTNVAVLIVAGVMMMVSATLHAEERHLPGVIFETDMCTDVDDVGALAMLHALADQGECEIIAIGYNATHPHGAGAIAAINAWYGRPHIPIGVYKLEHPDTTDPSAYCEVLHTRFAPRVGLTATMPDVLQVYRDALKSAPDQSVVIASVGFTHNLSLVVDKEPELIARKVRELVIMGSTWDDGWNLKAHEMNSYTQNVIEKWPGRIVFSSAGSEVITGARLVETPENNPVRVAYQHYHQGVEGRGRQSWDQLAVLHAVRGGDAYFTYQTEGECRLHSGWTWSLSQRMVKIIPREGVDLTRVVEGLMMQAPASASAGP
jgi:hypothetical protein